MRKLWSVLSVKNWFQKIFDLLWSSQYKIIITPSRGKPQKLFGRSFEASLLSVRAVTSSDHWRLRSYIDEGYSTYLCILDHPPIGKRALWYFFVRSDDTEDHFGLVVLGDKSYHVQMSKQKIPWWHIWTRLAILRARSLLMV